jgi:hypothetical protein
MEASRKRWTTTPNSSGTEGGLLRTARCRDLPQPATGGNIPRVDGKEGVAGSSPAEGSSERPGGAAFPSPDG